MIIETILFALGIASVASTETTGKSITDHAISAGKDQDCKMARGFKGEDVCQPVAPVAKNDKPRQDIPPVVPAPKRVVVVQNNSVDRAEDVFAQRKAMK